MKKRRAIRVLLLFSLLFLTSFAFPKEEGKFKPKLSIKLTGGLGYMNVGDLNTYLESFDNHLKTYTYFYDGGKIEKINNYGYDFDGELRLDINSKFAFGIGIGFMSRKCKSDFQTVGFWPLQTPVALYLHEFVFESKIETFPLKFEIYYTFPSSSRINLFLNSGLDYYLSNVYLFKYHWFNDLETGLLLPAIRFETYDVKSNFFGYHIGLGFEYNLLNNIFLVLEIQGKYAKSENLKGNREYNYAVGYQGTEVGNLYIGEQDLTGVGYGDNCPNLIISPSRPSGDEFRNIRNVILDFSGVSVLFGIRFKLF